MKTLILSIVIVTLVHYAYAQNVNIPDANFKNALIEIGVDTSGDGEISHAEAEAIISLEVWYKNITDMTGIEAFVNLDTLNCEDNQLINLDVSNNTALTELNCRENQLTSLDVSNNTALEYLFCGENQLTSLDVSNNTALKDLDCYGNQLTSLNVSNNTALIKLRFSSNQLTSLDITNNLSLTELTCDGNQLSSLDVSNCTALTWLICGCNHHGCFGGNQLTSLDVSGSTALTYLSCNHNQLTSLDISNNTSLAGLQCGDNQLTSLDVSNNTDLTDLDLSDMSSLYEVCVWTTPFPPDTVSVNTTGSPNVCFETDCNGVCEITEIKECKKELATIFPNPSDDIINIQFEKTNNATIEIYNIMGRRLYNNVVYAKTEKIDVSTFIAGVYLIKIKQVDKIYIEKVIVR